MHGDLIQRLQDATEGSRELDARIAYALGWRFNGFEWNEQHRDQPTLSNEQFAEWEIMAGGWKNPTQSEWPHPGDNKQEPPAFSSSIDAAMTLVPKGAGGEQLLTKITIAPLAMRRPPVNCEIIDTLTGRSWNGDAASPALALCIAELTDRGEAA